MVDWRLREGIILTEIQGVYLLVANKKARKHCRFASRVNETGAFFWKLLSEGKLREEIIAAIRQEFEMPEETDPEEDFNLFLLSLQENHYIISEDEGNEI